MFDHCVSEVEISFVKRLMFSDGFIHHLVAEDDVCLNRTARDENTANLLDFKIDFISFTRQLFDTCKMSEKRLRINEKSTDQFTGERDHIDSIR